MQTIVDKQTESADESIMFISFCLDIQGTYTNFITNHTTIPEDRKAVGDCLYGEINVVCLMEQNGAKNEKNGEKG